jgi:signal peptidase I
VTDDVETPTVVEPPSGSVPPPSGNGDGADGLEPPAASDAPAPREGKRSTKRAALEWGILIVVAIVIAIVIKTFLFQAFYIPSESMVPTLEVGDRVLVNKLSYDLHDLHRGDIVVFAAEPNEEWHRAGIDDRLLDESYLPKGTVTNIPSTLPFITNAAGKKVLVCDPVGPNGSPEGGCKVPAGQVFVMGDNRTNSQDARANGPIKASSIVGRVFLRIWPPGRIGFM